MNTLLRLSGKNGQCKLAAYDIPDSASYFGLSVPIYLSLAYVVYGSLTVTTVPPYNDLIILLVCFCSECFLLPSRQQVSNHDWYIHALQRLHSCTTIVLTLCKTAERGGNPLLP